MRNTSINTNKTQSTMIKLGIAAMITLSVHYGAGALPISIGASYAQQAGVKEAIELIKNKSFARAHEILLSHAKQGNAEAQGLLGEMYWFGDGIAVDAKEAEKWFKLGAEKADPKSQGFINLIAQREARKGEISFYTNESVDPKFRYLDSKCITPDYGINSYAYNQKLNTIWRKCYREFQGAIKQAKEQDQVVVPEDLLQILTEDEIKKVEANNSKIADLILANMEKSKSEIDKAFVAWAETRRNELRNSMAEKAEIPMQTIELPKTVR